MKKLIVLMALLLALPIAATATEYTNFDALSVTELAIGTVGAETTIIDSSGNISLTGTFANTGATASFTNATSFSAYTPAIYLGYDSGARINLAVSDTTGNVAITHTGSGPAVTWTADSFDLVGAISLDATTLSDVLTFSDGGTIDNTGADTLTITETNIDLVGALAADAVTLSDVLTFSDGGTIDNTDATTLTVTEDNIALTGAVAVTGSTAFTGTVQAYSQPVVLNTRHRVTIAEINAGHEILPAIEGRTYRIISVKAIAYGGAVGTTTTVDVLGTQSTGSVKIVTFARGDLAQSVVLTDSADGTVLADGASFVACDANTAITVGKTGSDADTATGVDFIITYVVE
jgi:hypothetical protein